MVAKGIDPEFSSVKVHLPRGGLVALCDIGRWVLPSVHVIFWPLWILLWAELY